jgi:hypothetical protein
MSVADVLAVLETLERHGSKSTRSSHFGSRPSMGGRYEANWDAIAIEGEDLGRGAQYWCDCAAAGVVCVPRKLEIWSVRMDRVKPASVSFNWCVLT